MTKYKKNNFEKWKKLLVLLLLLISALIIAYSLYLLFLDKPEKPEENLYAGIGGAVNDPGVYPVSETTLLYELILKAKGLSQRANVENINTNSKVVPFEVYCIPYLPEKKFKKHPQPVVSEPERSQLSVLKTSERINIIYAGLPRTYLLISLFPDRNLVTITHIPWFTKATTISEYPRTLYEIYLTGGVPFLARSIKQITEQTIKFYFAQDRPAWINFINYLGGIEVNIPQDFADEYNIESGKRTLDGLLSWEYIRFINKEQRRENQWLTGSSLRIQRQKEFMNSMFKKFKKNNFMMQGEILYKIIRDAETNMKVDDFIAIVNKMRKTKSPQVKFYTLPGVLQNFDGRTMWVSDVNAYHLKQNEIYNEIFRELSPIQHDKGGFGGKN
ncbi:MAG: hypothetical protein B6D62_03535 [Candidatus Cloacimonas sp. 4484_275]|nr:MAG: hypothetical protein B6D62_03535 [Candidatus Cloacimonas sp. 4484_275]